MGKQENQLPLGLILAGGQSRRMGGADKAWLRLSGRSLLSQSAARLSPQVASLAISANSDPQPYHAALPGVPVLPDPLPGFLGPLAGVLAGLHLAEAAGLSAIVTVAVDTPFFPDDLVSRLRSAGSVAIAATDSGLHPTFALWPVALASALEIYLRQGGRKLTDFALAQGAVTVPFASDGYDPFFNINTPDQLVQAEALAEILS